MTEEQKATHENQRVPFDLGSCLAMMEEMMGQEGCDCSEMTPQPMRLGWMMGQGGYAEMMSQMMTSCCGVQGETEETTTT